VTDASRHAGAGPGDERQLWQLELGRLCRVVEFVQVERIVRLLRVERVVRLLRVERVVERLLEFAQRLARAG